MVTLSQKYALASSLPKMAVERRGKHGGGTHVPTPASLAPLRAVKVLECANPVSNIYIIDFI